MAFPISIHDDCLLEALRFLLRDELDRCLLVDRQWHRLISRHASSLARRAIFWLHFTTLESVWWHFFTVNWRSPVIINEKKKSTIQVLDHLRAIKVAAVGGQQPGWGSIAVARECLLGQRSSFDATALAPDPLNCGICGQQLGLSLADCLKRVRIEPDWNAERASHCQEKLQYLMKNHVRTKHRKLYDAFASAPQMFSEQFQSFPIPCYFLAVKCVGQIEFTGAHNTRAMTCYSRFCWLAQRPDMFSALCCALFGDNYILFGHITFAERAGWELLHKATMLWDELHPQQRDRQRRFAFKMLNFGLDDCLGSLVLRHHTSIGRLYDWLVRVLDVEMLLAYMPLPISVHLAEILRAKRLCCCAGIQFPAHLDVQGRARANNGSDEEKKSTRELAAIESTLHELIFGPLNESPVHFTNKRMELQWVIREQQSGIKCVCGPFVETALQSLSIYPIDVPRVRWLNELTNEFLALEFTAHLKGRWTRFILREDCGDGEMQMRGFGAKLLALNGNLERTHDLALVARNCGTGDRICFLFRTHDYDDHGDGRKACTYANDFVLQFIPMRKFMNL